MRTSASTCLTAGLLVFLGCPDFDHWLGNVRLSAAQTGERRSDTNDVGRIAALDGAAQRKALRTFLLTPPDDLVFRRSFMHYEGQLRRSLRALSMDAEVGDAARWLLALIGAPGDLRWLVQNAPRINHKPFSNRWAYAVACALLEPSSEVEWEFLRKAAVNGFNDRWADAGAIQTLKLISSPQSLAILEEARHSNPHRVNSIGRSLDYIRSSPAPLTGANLEELARRVALAVKVGEWEGNENLRYNRSHDKALVDFAFHTREDRYIYTATFHQVSGMWRLRGLRETLQQFGPPSVPMPAPSVQIPPPPVMPVDAGLLPDLPVLLEPQQIAWPLSSK